MNDGILGKKGGKFVCIQKKCPGQQSDYGDHCWCCPPLTQCFPTPDSCDYNCVPNSK